MRKGMIRLSYRKLIDSTASRLWEQYVFEDTYKEFYLQAQQFDQSGKYTTFQEMIKHIPKADQMHYLVSTAAVGYIRQLQERIPDVTNVFGKPCISFKNFRFEMVQSHIRDKKQHQVAIQFYSEPLIWIDTVDKQLLLAPGDQLEALQMGEEVETDLVSMIPHLSISFFKIL